MDMKAAIDKVVLRQDLSYDEMREVMQLVMTGQATPAQIGGLLIGLRMKGESVDEIVASAEVMRELATPVKVSHDNLVDIVGTGGDGANLFNVSTTSSIVVAAAGGRVAKHGNRSVSSSSGSADLLDKAGVKLDLTPEQVARCIEEVKLGFMFAPMHHSAMRHAVGPRKEMGVRTLFNILGPLTNPAGAQHQLIGVYDKALLPVMAEALKKLGSKHVMVVHSEEGLDEISIAAPTYVAELKEGSITEYVIEPEDFGLDRGSLDELKVYSAEESLALVKRVLDNESGAALDTILLNAGAALYVADVADTLAEGVAMAQDAIDSELAKERLRALVDFTRVFAER